jgi:hypothetical protein
MKTIYYFLILVLLMSLTPAKAQTLRLSDEEQAAFKERIGQMLKTFLNDLSLIGSKDKENTDTVKKAVIKSTLRLFVNNGNAYYDKNGNFQKEPHMQISTLRGGIETKRSQPIKTYLNNLKNINYEKVTIKKANTFYLSNLYEVGDHYEAVATYFQYFRGESGDRVLYQDTTKKTIRIIVQIERILGDLVYVVRFSDIDVTQTLPE